MDDLYREVIIEHYKHPSYRGRLDPHDIQFADSNPLCGDHIEITLRTDDQGRVADARFDGRGCAISQASAGLAAHRPATAAGNAAYLAPHARPAQHSCRA